MSRTGRWVGSAVLAVLVAMAGFAAWGLRVPRVPLPDVPGTLRTDSVDVAGRQRSFHLYVPRHLPPAPGLLLVLHGSGMDGLRMRAVTGREFDVIAERAGILVAYPDGWDGNWNDCRAGGDYEARRLGIDDVAFMRALIDWSARAYGAAPDRVFAVGVSNGGQLAYRIGFEAPELVRGIAIVAAGLPSPGVRTCTARERPIAAMIINGTGDPLNPYRGGEVALWGFVHKRGLVASTDASARYWAKLAGHTGEPIAAALPDRDPHDGTTATRFTWAGEGGPEVVLIRVEGGGHAWPHPQLAFPRIFGHTSHDFSAADEVWQFFARIPGPLPPAGAHP